MTDISGLRIFVCTAPIKMNISFDSLMGLAQAVFDQDPLAGHLGRNFLRTKSIAEAPTTFE
jgi:hypothetical protein